MIVYICAGDAMLSQVREGLPAHIEFQSVRSVASLPDIRNMVEGMLVWDIEDSATKRAHAERELSLPRTIPIILVAPPTASGFRLLSMLTSTRPIRGIVCKGANDAPSDVREFIRSVRQESLSLRVLQRIRDQIDNLPQPTVAAVELLFSSPARFASITDLATFANRSRRAFDRDLQVTGTSAAALIRCARLARVIACMRLNIPVKSSVAQAGYSNSTTFKRDLDDFAGGGATASFLSADGTDDLIDRLARVLRRRVGESVGDEH